jgi:hypothetical protein
MQNTTDNNSRSPPSTRGVVTRAQAGPGNDTAQPSLTSGFGAVIEKEYDLLTATEGSFDHVTGGHAAEIDRILHHQQSRLGANIALLEQRYEALPNPERFKSWGHRGRPTVAPRRTRYDETDLLPDLIALHTALLGDIEALIVRASDGQRGELILTEVSRNHEEMAWMLTALLKEDESGARLPDDAVGAAPNSTLQAQENWDNEGGPVCIKPAVR